MAGAVARVVGLVTAFGVAYGEMECVRPACRPIVVGDFLVKTPDSVLVFVNVKAG